MKRLFVLILIATIVGLSIARAQRAAFQSKLLSEIGHAIGYVPDSNLEEGTYPAGTALGKPLVAEYDSHHTVTNLGFRLFSQEQKKVYASDVYAFLERYFLELYVWEDKSTLQQKLADDKVYFTKGSIASLKNIDETTPCMISRVEDKFYEVAWADTTGAEILSVAFPIQYELLLGMSQVEIANTMYDRIVGASAQTAKPISEVMENVKDNIYSSTPKKHYQLESVNNIRYFKKTAEGDYKLIIDKNHADYSVTNIFHEPSACNNPLLMQQSVYGFKTLDYTVTLNQWINYCLETGLTTYTAIEEEYDDAFKVLIVAESKDLGFNHILSAIVPRNFMEKPSAEIKCKLNAFIPTHNVKDLYQQYKEKTKKKY